jgi:TolA-binding protein
LIPGLRLAAPLLVAAALLAPFQCARKPPPEQRMEDDAAEVLYTLAEKFKTEGNQPARAETLRYLLERYPASRFAVTAKSDLDALGGKP